MLSKNCHIFLGAIKIVKKDGEGKTEIAAK